MKKITLLFSLVGILSSMILSSKLFFEVEFCSPSYFYPFLYFTSLCLLLLGLISFALFILLKKEILSSGKTIICLISLLACTIAISVISWNVGYNDYDDISIQDISALNMDVSYDTMYPFYYESDFNKHSFHYYRSIVSSEVSFHEKSNRVEYVRTKSPVINYSYYVNISPWYPFSEQPGYRIQDIEPETILLDGTTIEFYEDGTYMFAVTRTFLDCFYSKLTKGYSNVEKEEFLSTFVKQYKYLRNYDLGTFSAYKQYDDYYSTYLASSIGQ